MFYAGIYHELPLTAIIYLPMFTCFYEKKGIVLLLCIFEPTVRTNTIVDMQN